MNKRIGIGGLQEMAALCCYISYKKFKEITDADGNIDALLMKKLNVDLKQFSTVVRSILESGNLDVSFSLQPNKSFIALQRNDRSIDSKVDPFYTFLQIVEDKAIKGSSSLGLQKMAVLCCELSDEKLKETIATDGNMDASLMKKLGVNFEQFSAIIDSILNRLKS